MTSGSEPGGSASRDRSGSLAAPLGKAARCTSYFLLAIGVGGAVTVALAQLIPTRLDVTTDTLGYPTRFDFNVYGHWYLYGLLVFALPLTILITYWVATRRQRLRMAPASLVVPTPVPSLTAERANVAFPDALVQVVRLLVVGGVLGLELSIALQHEMSSTISVLIVTAIVYAGAVLGVALILRKTRRGRPSAWETCALLNSAGAVLCAIGLYGVSQVTQVSIISNHTVRNVDWMPIGLALPIAVIALAGLALYLRRDRAAVRVRNAERWMILLVALPAAFFVLHARVPGALGVVGSFEDGQLLVGANQVLHGAFPWRDIILTHGIFNDSLLYMPGLALIEVSRWGAWAGYYLLVEPVYWLVLYGLVLYLTRGRWAYAALFLGVVVLGNSFLNGFFSQVHARFLLYPLVVIAFGLLLQRATWLRAAAFSVGLLALVILTPEALFLVPLAVGLLFLFELTTRQRTKTARVHVRDVRRLLQFLACSAVGCAVVAVWLAWNNAFGAFVFYFKTFVPAHVLEGIPVELSNQTIFVAARYVPIVLAVLYLGAVALALLWRRQPRLEDWVGSLLASATVLYYAKFLGRPDPSHLFQFLAFATPFLLYAVFRSVDAFQNWIAQRHWGPRPLQRVGGCVITAALLIGVFVPTAGDLTTAIRHAPSHFVPKVEAPATIPRLGYADALAANADQFNDLHALISTIGGPHARVWDFSNSPAYMYFIEGFNPPTRYDNVSIAIRSSTQQNLISELRSTHPDVIVYASVSGLGTWDGLPNMVRHYDVSAWILKHYRPVVGYGGNVIYASNSRPVSVAALKSLKLTQPIDTTTDLYTEAVGPCDWGYVPNFFSQRPAANGSSQSLPLVDAGRHELISGRVVQDPTDLSLPVQVFATANGSLLADGRIDPQIGISPSGIGFGFDIDVPLGLRAPSEVSVSVRHADGSVAPLTTSRVGPSSAVGTIDATRVVWEDRLTVPANASLYHWLELTNTNQAPVQRDTFALSAVNEQSHGIYFATTSTPPRPYNVRLDNCSQWAALPGASAVLVHDQRQPNLAARLRT